MEDDRCHKEQISRRGWQNVETKNARWNRVSSLLATRALVHLIGKRGIGDSSHVLLNEDETKGSTSELSVPSEVVSGFQALCQLIGRGKAGQISAARGFAPQPSTTAGPSVGMRKIAYQGRGSMRSTERIFMFDQLPFAVYNHILCLSAFVQWQVCIA